MSVVSSLGHALWMAFAMFWEILWALILGFLLSAIVQAVVSKAEMSRLLPDDSPKTLLKAMGLGAASSSCSYAAVALARSIFRTAPSSRLPVPIPDGWSATRTEVWHGLFGGEHFPSRPSSGHNLRISGPWARNRE